MHKRNIKMSRKLLKIACELPEESFIRMQPPLIGSISQARQKKTSQINFTKAQTTKNSIQNFFFS